MPANSSTSLGVVYWQEETHENVHQLRFFLGDSPRNLWAVFGGILYRRAWFSSSAVNTIAVDKPSIHRTGCSGSGCVRWRRKVAHAQIDAPRVRPLKGVMRDTCGVWLYLASNWPGSNIFIRDMSMLRSHWLTQWSRVRHAG